MFSVKNLIVYATDFPLDNVNKYFQAKHSQKSVNLDFFDVPFNEILFMFDQRFFSFVQKFSLFKPKPNRKRRDIDFKFLKFRFTLL